MDGLIKDLVGVALGRLNNDEESNPEIRDERSRSTWAEVSSYFTQLFGLLFFFLWLKVLLISDENLRLYLEIKIMMNRGTIADTGTIEISGIQRFLLESHIVSE